MVQFRDLGKRPNKDCVRFDMAGSIRRFFRYRSERCTRKMGTDVWARIGCLGRPEASTQRFEVVNVGSEIGGRHPARFLSHLQRRHLAMQAAQARQVRRWQAMAG
ncbi:hypothetical protein CFAM422_007106 [Trichoderma lentiforme]|uniref:Uncharacterized protein n=1 Tax=Trichoderma lentiforme TaxID=1567552 RepID=A0A9P5CAK0_9HYPO|nr:hypothetical protein CFAM422_007106 [Trichoderma lentiforme]